MYNYGPGQHNPSGQYPDPSANSPYGSQPQYPHDPNAYPQQQQQPPPVSPTQPYDPSPPMTSGPPAAQVSPQFSGGAAVPAYPTAPVTGAGPLEPTMFGAPGVLPPPPKKRGVAVPILAGVSALLLIGTVVFLVLFLNAKSDLTEARSTITENEDSIDKKDGEIKDLKGDKEDAEETAEDSEECVKLVEDMFTELYGGADTDKLDKILKEMQATCQSA